MCSVTPVFNCVHIVTVRTSHCGKARCDSAGLQVNANLGHISTYIM